MQTYDCVVRLKGDIMHEVDKQGVTAPEIMVLAHIHGTDALRGIRPGAVLPEKFNSARERGRLDNLYGPRPVTAVFGNPIMGAKLPARLAEDFGQADEDDGEDAAGAEDDAPAARRTLKLDKGAQASA